MTDAPQDPNSDETPETLADTQARMAAGSNSPEPTPLPPVSQNSAPAQQTSPVEPAANSTDAQPTAPQPYGATLPQTPYTQTPIAPADATQTTPLDPNQTWSAPSASADGSDITDSTATGKKRSNRVGLVAALVVGALIGGVSGAGVSWAVAANSSNGSNTSTVSARPQNVIVNNTDKVNVVTAVAAKASPSVVTISVTSSSAAGTGSGVVLSKDGYVLTNTHVVTLDGEISKPTVQVTTSDGHLYDATVVGTDPVADLAVIKLKNVSDLTPATFGDSSKLNVGETAIAIGAPLGLSNTVTDGIVSALNRSISIASSAAPTDGDTTTPNSTDPFQFDNGSGSTSTTTPAATISLPVIQTDAAINPGNSGGALLDSNGKVIGINVAIASAGETSASSQSGNIGVGFAIPANLAKRVAEEIMKNGTATHGLLGASVADVAASDSSSVVGAVIKAVSSGGGAANAGIKAGDIVTSFDGAPITSGTDLTAQVRYLAAGSKTSLTYVRNGSSTTVDVTLGTLK